MAGIDSILLVCLIAIGRKSGRNCSNYNVFGVIWYKKLLGFLDQLLTSVIKQYTYVLLCFHCLYCVPPLELIQPKCLHMASHYVWTQHYFPYTAKRPCIKLENAPPTDRTICL
jgi:hypothetical protein